MDVPRDPGPTDPPSGSSRAVIAALRTVPAGLAALAVYVALEWLGFIHEVKGLPATPWNPGLGVVFALIAVDGPLAAAVLFAGIVLAEVLVVDTALSWPLVLAVAAIETACYAAAGTVALRAFRLDVALGHLRDVLLLLAAGFAGACLVALLLTALLIAFGDLGTRDVLAATVPLLVGDVIGIAVITPLVLRLAAAWRSGGLRFGPALAAEAAACAAAIGACLWLVTASPGPEGFKYFHLLALPVVTAAVRHGLDGACLSLAGVQLGLVALLHLHGHDIRVFTEYQALMLVLTATGLVVGVVVSERRSAERLARAAEARAKDKEAEAAQAGRFHLVSGMASALAHEINQPMTAARALARAAQHILQTPGGDLARAEANLGNAVAQIDHAGAVIRRMRDFLRRGAPVREPIAIDGLVDDVVAIARADARAHAVRLVAEVPAGLPPVTGDRVQLQQVLLNLVRNAVEAISAARRDAAGLPPGQVRITAAWRHDPPGVEIAVVDNGPGVPDELADVLFEPLTTSKEDGLGLGLAICASIVEQHGGRIALASRAPGTTEFRVTLPIEGFASSP
ncbi:ATP-binding protein [Rhodoplanes sp. TEM]|uniref:histidine kinase n=1 Tax=Rhodoplanes tepidamans TaxID=200616 RepID=A0ABT5J9I1_RHOTP|nr:MULTISPECIES: ATP-binding protein [Rhodoplanes]MDC7786066.1 ATP-binding protein [Rhodoplanes tepidamans]MDC7983793.1 ATP-binding protein [Rhodoplanes sp. TEM]MDQ0354909.1 signal transduction histidine kinase [Rhodoplanes tepidamans]